MRKKIKIDAIDLFCGVGGLTYGLRKAGINVLAGLDNDKSCQYAYEKNNKNCRFIFSDIAKYDFTEMKKMYSDNSIKALVGCAPCQPFSAHNYKIYKNQKGKQKGAHWNLINYFTEAVKILEPDIISMENVRGIKTTDVFKKFLADMDALNYQVTYDILYCPNYGIPQNRSRLVLLGSKKGKIELPQKTHEKGEYITVRKVIGNLPPLESGQTDSKDPLHRVRNLSPLNLKRIRESKPQRTWEDWPKNLLPDCYKRESGQTYKTVYGRMGWDSVSPTMTTQFYHYGAGRFGHPVQHRALSLREGAILQTFPDDYNFGQKITLMNIGRHIGNAVPPKLGEVIGDAIMKHIRRINNEKI